MVTVFCPGHITCFFSPAGDSSDDVLHRGSIGAGIRTSLGTRVEVTERSGSIVHMIMDGQETDLPVTRLVADSIAPGRGLDITIENDLPCGEGFGMSASGAIAVAFALSEILGKDDQYAFETAHAAEIRGGGGLGDVSAIQCPAHQPVRVRQGIAPYGETVGTGVRFDRLTLAVLGTKMNTGKVLGDPERYSAIRNAGRSAVSEYLESPSTELLFSLSNRFSAETGLECEAVSTAISKLSSAGYHSAMCMLGNSIFTDAPADVTESLLGTDAVFSCRSTDSLPGITRKA